MAMNVKFFRGTTAAFTALATKDQNTFYYITDGRKQLYLGDVLLGDNVVATDYEALKARVLANETSIADIKKTLESLADNSTVADLISRVGAIEVDYLKAADKIELSNAISAETTRAQGVESGLDSRIVTLEAFFAGADTGAETVIDTLKEIQNYIANDQTGASAMLASIQQNTDAIAAEKTRAETAESNLSAQLTSEVDRAKAAEEANAANITALDTRLTQAVADEKARAEAAEKVNADAIAALNSDLSAYKTSNDASVASVLAKAEAAQAAADQSLVDAKAYADSVGSAVQGSTTATVADCVKAINQLSGSTTQTESDINAISTSVANIEDTLTWGTIPGTSSDATV